MQGLVLPGLLHIRHPIDLAWRRPEFLSPPVQGDEDLFGVTPSTQLVGGVVHAQQHLRCHRMRTDAVHEFLPFFQDVLGVLRPLPFEVFRVGLRMSMHASDYNTPKMQRPVTAHQLGDGICASRKTEHGHPVGVHARLASEGVHPCKVIVGDVGEKISIHEAPWIGVPVQDPPHALGQKRRRQNEGRRHHAGHGAEVEISQAALVPQASEVEHQRQRRVAVGRW
mmetsp:Transcript_4196/g.10619  ORF Transcript_4196/g.10619 Transcript_4196/m.10619 type:complete len:224 (-) Transcript_4196:162-833(-)